MRFLRQILQKGLPHDGRLDRGGFADVTEDTLELAQFAALKCPIKAITLEE